MSKEDSPAWADRFILVCVAGAALCAGLACAADNSGTVGGSGGSVSQGGGTTGSGGGAGSGHQGGAGGMLIAGMGGVGGSGTDAGTSTDAPARCQSDNQCTGMGLLCDTVTGVCVACLKEKDCPASSYCGAGQCRPDVCVPGTSNCTAANAAQTCNASGSGFDPARPCAARQTCVAPNGLASCRNWVCNPDTVECVDRIIVTCSKDGLAEISRVDCAQNGQYCAAGKCADRLCTSGQRHCYMEDVYLCDATGLNRALVQNCSDTTEYCDGQAAVPICKARVCVPLTGSCNGNTAVTCNAGGSGYQAGAKDCAVGGQICSMGACVDGLCTAGQRHCHMEDVYQCDATGLNRALVQNCSDTTEYCDGQAAVPICKTRVCVPFASECNGNIAATCNANGSGYQAGAMDCAAAGRICSAGACIAGAVDAVGQPGFFIGAVDLYGNKYQVTMDRTLIEIELYVSFPTGQTITWAVFERSTANGSFTRIWTKNETVAVSAMAGYRSSGAVNIPLVAGRFYVIGVDGSASVDTYFDLAAALPQATSFGSVLGYTSGPGTVTSYTFSTSTGQICVQRLTTTP